MPNYRRYPIVNHSVFITLVTAGRKPLLVAHHTLLRQAFLTIKQRHAFRLPAMVVLPDHCHFIMELPEGDTNFSARIGLIKAMFSRALPKVTESLPNSRISRRERGIWQRRFWEHTLRDEEDYQRHFDYIHYNPVKHGYAIKVADWQFSTFHRYFAQGIYPHDWGNESSLKTPITSAGE